MPRMDDMQPITLREIGIDEKGVQQSQVPPWEFRRVLAINRNYLHYRNKFNLKVKEIPHKRTNTIKGYELTTRILWSDRDFL